MRCVSHRSDRNFIAHFTTTAAAPLASLPPRKARAPVRTMAADGRFRNFYMCQGVRSRGEHACRRLARVRSFPRGACTTDCYTSGFRMALSMHQETQRCQAQSFGPCRTSPLRISEGQIYVIRRLLVPPPPPSSPSRSVPFLFLFLVPKPRRSSPLASCTPGCPKPRPLVSAVSVESANQLGWPREEDARNRSVRGSPPLRSSVFLVRREYLAGRTDSPSPRLFVNGRRRPSSP